MILDLVFVNFSHADIGYEKFPDPGGTQDSHLVFAAMPDIKIANYTHIARVGRPHREIHSFNAVDLHRVRAKLFVNLLMIALPEKI